MADGSDQVISIGVNQYQIIFRDTREDAAALIVKNQKSKKQHFGDIANQYDSNLDRR
jgi:predicted phage-related endonuclease